MSIEDDIERIAQVTDRLVGPQKVWVLLNKENDGSHVYVFSSEAIARSRWLVFLEADFTCDISTSIDYHAAVERVNNGFMFCVNASGESYVLHEEEIVCE